MADQNANPIPWHDDMSDGCSGVPNWWWKKACVAHDKAHYYGGTVEDKLKADDQFYLDMCNTPGMGGWVARNGAASLRYHVVRLACHNYPPGHELRFENSKKYEVWNWIGPGMPKGQVA